MKPILMVLGLVLAAGAGAVGGVLSAPRAHRVQVESPAPVAASTAVTTPVTPAVEKRIQDLSMALATVEAELAALKDERSRAPAAASTTPAAGASAAERLTSAEQTAAFAALHKDAILKVLADERAAQEQKREAERKQREETMLAGRADRAAEKFNLSGAQRQTLLDYYVAERARFEEIRGQFRDGAQDGPEAVREAMRAGREWRANELTKLFGTDLGAQISEFENEGFRGRVSGVQRRGGGGEGGAGGAFLGGESGAGGGRPRAGGGGF